MGSNVFVISDNHFYHTNILKYQNRHFESVLEMNEYMIDKWNSVVKKRDKVFHLGDFVLGNKDMIKEIVNRLNGAIYLIKGNHDKHPDELFYSAGIKKVYDMPIIYKQKVILSHMPVKCLTGDLINIHGHTHNKNVDGRFNVSVEVIDYTPINIGDYYEKINY